MKILNRWHVVLCLAVFVTPVRAGEVQPPQIEVQGEAEVLLEPDYIEWVVDIRTRDKVPKVAREVNERIYEALLDIAGKADIDAKEIITGDPLHKQLFRDTSNDRREIDDYVATEVYRRVTLVMRDMGEFTEMLDAVHPLGVFYAVRRKSTLYDETLRRVTKAALKDARGNAVDQAAALGQNIGKATNVEVSRLKRYHGHSVGGLFGPGPPESAIEDDETTAGPDGKIRVLAYAYVRFSLE